VNSTPSAPQRESPCNVGSRPDVCAVMVTYNPDASLEQNVRALLPQVSKLIVVDNQSSSAAHSLIARIASACGAEIIWNDRNLGIAAGLNAGIERAVACGQHSWIATFDQDSLVPPDFVDAIFEAYSACPFREKVAMIGANYKLAMRESTSEPISVRNGLGFREVRTLMTSGSFLKSSVFADCGRFDQSLFMDYVDHEFCLRLRRHGFKVIQASRAVLTHRLGSPTSHRILAKRFMVTNYSPTRRYSNARNRLIVYRRYLNSDRLWILQDIFEWFRETAKMVLVEQNRTEKLVSLIRGCWDGIREPLVAQASPPLALRDGAAGEQAGEDRELGR
jgi:rhamnosyltransferase